jgi:hypothetical protein
VIGFLQIVTLAAIVLNGLNISIGQTHVTTERLILPLVAFGLAIKIFSKTHIRLARPTKYYVVFLLFALVSAISSGIIDHGIGLALTILPFSFFLLFMQNGLSRRALNSLFEITLWYLALGGIIAFILLKNSDGALPLIGNMLDNSKRVQLTMSEPNIFGATVAILMVYHFSCSRLSTRHASLYALSFVALILSGSKMPALAFLVGLAFFIIRSDIIRKRVPIFLVLIGGISIIMIGILYSGSIYKYYDEMLARPETVNIRLTILSIAWHRFLDNPIIGNGPLDFGLHNQHLLDAMGTEDTRTVWIANIGVAILHDEGIVGIIVFSAFLFACWQRGQRAIRVGDKAFVSYLAALLVMLVADQATSTHLSAIFGMVTGLVCSPAVKPVKARAQGQGRSQQV